KSSDVARCGRRRYRKHRYRLAKGEPPGKGWHENDPPAADRACHMSIASMQRFRLRDGSGPEASKRIDVGVNLIDRDRFTGGGGGLRGEPRLELHVCRRIAHKNEGRVLTDRYEVGVGREAVVSARRHRSHDALIALEDQRIG